MAKLTQDQIDELAELREAGWSDGALAQRFAVSKSAISWHSLMLGIHGAAQSKWKGRGIGPLVIMRNGKPVRRFTPEEDAKLLDLAEQTASRRAIGRAMGRNQRSIVARLATLARRAELAA